MPIPIISERKRCSETTYYREFDYRGERGHGFSFPCTKDGVMHFSSPAAAENFGKCIDGTYDVVDRGIRSHTNVWTEPAVGRCDCGAEVVLDGFTCTCEKCGADYNSSGQRLAPREQWGEETGESLADILSIR